MKKVIFEQSADTIQFDKLKGDEFMGADIQNTKVILIKNIDGRHDAVTQDLHYASGSRGLELKGGIITNLYTFDSLIELVTWLTSE